MNEIAVVGLSCKYPDADNHIQLWENILSKRRAFRKMPEKRLSADYFSDNLQHKDKIYHNKVAVLKNYTFDRAKFKISNSNYKITDLTHWLALDVANDALKNAKLENIGLQDRVKTGVIVGNTLTGEFSRANILRIRWPYIAKNVASQLKTEGWEDNKIEKFVLDLEQNYKAPFPEMEEDSLAGGLSNTIAGRICNYFDFKGGGYTIDGACSSSLLAIANACNLIKDGDLSIALVGGVDLSLDPFELVGFSRTGALAKKEMLVYDEASSGFIPGEGCGFVVLTSLEYAQKNNLSVLGLVKGWGISSDGQGGITRPSVVGQTLAMERAYEKAGYSIADVDYIEGHGTGTNVGDTVELSTISQLLEKNHHTNTQLFVGSIKANIGHTKAAAGIAGFIKCLLVLKNRTVPPATGFKKKHSIFGENDLLKLPDFPVFYDTKKTMRAGVSSMGFGGINTHITVESHHLEKDVVNNSTFVDQNSELFLFSANTKKNLFEKLAKFEHILPQISIAELVDLSFELYKNNEDSHTWKLAIVANSGETLLHKINKLKTIENVQISQYVDIEQGIFLSSKQENIRFGYLFPGQGNSFIEQNNKIFQRFPFLKKSSRESFIPVQNKSLSTEVAQPALVVTSILGLNILQKLGVDGMYGIGHSLGELTGLYWSGATSESEILKLASVRGRLMNQSVEVKGKMLSVSCSHNAEIISKIIHDFKISLACINSEKQTVLSGNEELIGKAEQFLKKNNIACRLLNVENAFHSDLMKSIVPEFEEVLKSLTFSKPDKKLMSTVTAKVAEELPQNTLVEQLFSPVKFYQGVKEIEPNIDYWLEIGKGNTLKGLVEDISEKPVISLDLGENMTGILSVVALNYAFGNKINVKFLFENRFHRSFDLEKPFIFIENQCEQVANTVVFEGNYIPEKKVITEVSNPGTDSELSIEKAFIKQLSDKLDLPTELITLENRMLDDLHLNSLAVGQIIADFANNHHLKITSVPLEYSNSSVAEIISMLELHNQEEVGVKEETQIKGIKPWVFGFNLNKVENSLKASQISEHNTKWFYFNENTDVELKEMNVEEKGIFWNGFLDEKLNVINCLSEFCCFFRENQSEIKTVVVVQEKQFFSGFLKSLAAEYPSKKVLIINISKSEFSDEILTNELNCLEDFREVFYENGQRKIEEMTPHFFGKSTEFDLQKGDSILVTGGGKGITFECAKELAIKYKLKLILTGRSNEKTDDNLKQNLQILSKLGINYAYFQFDLTEENGIENLIQHLKKEEIVIQGIIHGAGINQPNGIARLTKANIQQTYDVKVGGAIKLLKVIEAFSPKFFIAFGSIIARIGMEGNADYAFANEMLRHEIEKVKDHFPKTTFRIYEWSVWSGTGMGEHLNVLENLLKKGIYPITLDEGIKYFLDTFNLQNASLSLIVSSRFSNLKTINQQQVNIPNLRFLEEIKVIFPQIEVISEAKLSSVYDWYLADHQIDEKLVLPAVVGIEAMFQLVKTLCVNPIESVNVCNISFLHPIIIPKESDTSIRIIVQRESENTFLAVIRAEESSFLHDYFRATIIVNQNTSSNAIFPLFSTESKLKIKEDFYGNIVFHKGVFQKISDYFLVNPYECVAIGKANNQMNYFSDFLPSELLLSDFTLRDAVIHAVQTCVPDKVLLPVAIDSFKMYNFSARETIIIHAQEIKKVENIYHYNISVFDEEKHLLEEFINIQFKEYSANNPMFFAPALAKNIAQRKIDEEFKQKNMVDIFFDSDVLKDSIYKRGDGKPLLINGFCSKTTIEFTKMFVHSLQPVACDIEQVMTQSEKSWNKLLNNEDYFLAKKYAEVENEDFNTLATRIWGIRESLRKLGDSNFMPLALSPNLSKENWRLYQSHNNTILSGKCKFEQNTNDVIITLVVKNNEIL